MATIAAKYGSVGWEKIYEDPENEGLRDLRPNPNVIFPGDEVVIPEPEAKHVDAAVGERHRFVLQRPRHELRLVVQDEQGNPLDGWQYQLHAGPETFEGEVSGPITHRVPVGLCDARLEVRCQDEHDPRCFAWDLKVGHLDPVDTISGVQARLRALGFDGGPIDGEHGDRTTAGIRAFQAAHGLEQNGEPGPTLHAKLEELHGC